MDEHGFIAGKTLPDGWLIAVAPLLFGRARLTIGHGGYLCYDRGY